MRPAGAKQTSESNDIKRLTGTLSVTRTLAVQLILSNLFRPPDSQKETPAKAGTDAGADTISVTANDESKATLKREAAQ